MKETCHSCNTRLKLVKGPGRFKMYRGVRCEFPANFGVRTCPKCKAEWMNSAEIHVMSDCFEKQRIAAQGK